MFIYNNSIYQGTDYKNVIGDSEISLKAASLNFINNIIYLEPSAKLGQAGYLFNVDTPNFAKNVMYGGTINTNFLNKDATRKELDPRFFDPGRRHYSGYKLKTFSPALGTALSFTEPNFPLAGVGIFQSVTSNASKDIFGNPVDLSTATNIGADNGIGESSAPTANSYEAESAVIAGGSEITCVNASGGKAVNVLGTGKTLTFSNVNVSASGLYLLNVFYANPTLSSLQITVNGGATESVLLPYSDGYCYQSGNPTFFPVIISLNSGTNSIILENGAIDKIEVESVNDATLNTNSEVFLDKANAYLEKTILSSDEILRVILNKETQFKRAQISIYDITGALIVRKDFSDRNINLPVYDFGSGIKIVVAKIDNHLFVDKIIVR